MKDLYAIIKESIFDDDDDQFDKMEDSVYNDMLAKLEFKIGADNKTIVWEPLDFGYHKDVHDRRISFGGSWTSKLESNLKTLKNADIIFQPLTYVHIEDDVKDTQNIIENFPCMGVCSLNVYLSNTYKIDFSKLNFPVYTSIHVSTGYKEHDLAKYDIIAPKQHIPVVSFSDPGKNNKWQPDNIKGWDCDVMIIDGRGFEEGGYAHGDGKIMGYSVEKLQQLIDNNPKAGMILIENGNRYWKVNTKTAKKKIDKLVNKKFEYHRDIYFDAQEHGWGWEAKNQDIIKRR